MSVLGLSLSILIGVSLGFFGGGGSILTVPLLVYVFGLAPKEAIASSLLVVAAASSVAAIQHARAGNLRPRVAALPALESATAFTEDSLGVWIWLPNFAPGDPLCCPSSWSQFLLSRVGPSWIVSEGIAGAPIETIPQPSDF